MSDIYREAVRYVERHGLKLVPLKPRKKIPEGNDWGKNPIATVKDVDALFAFTPDANIGVALGPSRMCSLDIDNMDATRAILEEFGWSIDEMVADYPVMRGKPDGMRFMFRVPDGVSLQYHALQWPKKDGAGSFAVFELRASDAGQQRQDVLPPSIHPDTGRPYEWITHPDEFATWPEPPAWLLSLWANYPALNSQLVDVCPWRTKPVPVQRVQVPRDPSQGESVIEAYNRAHSIEDALTRYGYAQRGRRWLSPSSGTGLPGVNVIDGNRCYIHHASDPLCSTESGRPVSPFDLFACYEHGGDLKKATRAAAVELGIEHKRGSAPVHADVDYDTGEIVPRRDLDYFLKEIQATPDRDGVERILNEAALECIWSPADSDRLAKAAKTAAGAGYTVAGMRKILTRGQAEMKIAAENERIARRRAQIERDRIIGAGTDTPQPNPIMSLEEMLSELVFIEDGSEVGFLSHPRRVVKLADLKTSLAGSITMVEDAKGNPRAKKTLELWADNPEKMVVHGKTFQPGHGTLAKDPNGKDCLNSWRPIKRDESAFDAGLYAVFVDHVEYLLGEDAPRLLDWLAHIEQRPGELPHTGWCLISKTPGTGRGWLSSVLARVWRGHVAVGVDLPGILDGGYTGILSQKLLVTVDELREASGTGRHHAAQRLKSIITESERKINPKYGRESLEPNCARWLMFSNHIGALPIENDDRRIEVVRCDAKPKTEDHYTRLYGMLSNARFIESVAVGLARRDISAFNPGAHAKRTEARQAMVDAGKTEWQLAVEEMFEESARDVVTKEEIRSLVDSVRIGSTEAQLAHIIEDAGGEILRKRQKMGRREYFVVIRNHERWREMSPAALRAEADG